MLHERKEQERNNHYIECCSICGERLTSFQEKKSSHATAVLNKKSTMCFLSCNQVLYFLETGVTILKFGSIES